MWRQLCRSFHLQKCILRSPWFARNLATHRAEGNLVSVQPQERDVAIRWSNNRVVSLPYIFLRDNCQEPESFDQAAKQRVFNPAFVIDLDIKPKHVEMSNDGAELCITWPDGHRSRYSSLWLLEHSDGLPVETRKLPVEKRYWRSDHRVARANFKELINGDDDSRLLEFLLQMESDGIVLVDDVGTESNQVKHLCTRIAYPKPCVQGRDVIEINMKSDDDSSYSNVDLPLYTSLPFYDYTPGIQLLHCMQQLSGKVRFCDGFSIANEIRETNPAFFQLLSQYPVHYVDIGKDYMDYNVESWHVPISVDSSGTVEEIHFNNQARGPRYVSSLSSRLQEWYEAYYRFSSLTISPQFLLELCLEPGQMVVFDNFRVLHGISSGHLEMAYLDWDETRSKARVIMG